MTGGYLLAIGSPVHFLRRLIMDNHALAGALIALALAMKMLVPAGFMPTISNGQIVVSVCTGMGAAKMVMSVPGFEHGKPGDSQHGKSEPPCAFSGLSAPSLSATDPVLLALAILFVMALVRRPMARLAAAAAPYLRPPSRGPPARL